MKTCNARSRSARLHRATEPHGTLTGSLSARRFRKNSRADFGDGQRAAIRHAVRDLVERSRAEAVIVELPLSSPAAAAVGESLEAAGLGFIGIGPHFSPSGDALKTAGPRRAAGQRADQTFEPFAARLTDYALAEQRRVRQSL